jgi:uncharacterized protein (DUF362 family)
VEAEGNVEAAVKEAACLIGWKPTSGERYLIKPNMITAKTSDGGVTTDPRIVKSLIQEVRLGGGIASVGDSPGNSYPGKARLVFEKTGMMKAIEELKAEYVEFEGTPPKIVGTGGSVISSVGLAGPIFERHLINVPKLKTHVQSVMTGAIKNAAFGCIPGSGKGALHIAGKNQDLFAKAIVDVYSALKPHISLNLMDAIICMEGNGPSAGRPKNIGRVLASTDALALDMVSFKMAGLEPDAVPYVKEAVSRSLGPSSMDDIEIIGELPLKKFKIPSTFLTKMSVSPIVKPVFSAISSTIKVDRSKCTRCGNCERACPVSAITMQNYAVPDQSKCIRCFVCFELCEFDAIKVKRSILS